MVCPFCKGSGQLKHFRQTCPTCKGIGEVMNKISGLTYSLKIHFEDEEMPEGFYESLNMIDIENKNQQAEIKKLWDGLQKIVSVGLSNLPNKSCDIEMLRIAQEALKDGEQ